MLSLELHFLFLLFSSQLLSGYLSLMSPQCPANNFSLLVALCSASINPHSLRSQKSFSSGGAIPLSVSSPFSPIPFASHSALPPLLPSLPQAQQHIQACLSCYLWAHFTHLYMYPIINILSPHRHFSQSHPAGVNTDQTKPFILPALLT